MTRVFAALLILALTALAIRLVAERKNQDLAGPSSYRLGNGPEREALEALLAELERLEHPELAARLHALDAEGRLWVAPSLPEGRQALYVNSLGLVKRVYVDRGALLLDALPFDDERLPDEWQRLYALLRLGGTLYHELQHLDGVLDESVAYQRELEWYASLPEAAYVRNLGPADRRGYRWAFESAMLSVRKAAAMAAQAADG